MTHVTFNDYILIYMLCVQTDEVECPRILYQVL
jgi:hypothetical protein